MCEDLLSRIVIAEERPEDIDGIRRVNQAAFKGDYEADMVDRFRRNCAEILSLVAKDGKQVVGHILFSPAYIIPAEGQANNGKGLAPLDVLPEVQGQGIGAALSRVGMARMNAAGYLFVIVLGHSTYYPRFSFTRASMYGVLSAFENVPDEAFMIYAFDPAALQGVPGVAHYRPEFDEVD